MAVSSYLQAYLDCREYPTSNAYTSKSSLRYTLDRNRNQHKTGGCMGRYSSVGSLLRYQMKLKLFLAILYYISAIIQWEERKD